MPKPSPSSLNRMVKALREKYGKDVVLLGSEVKLVRRMPTGLESLDRITGGGWPMGRISEVWGLQGSGKSTLVLLAIAALQKADPKARIAYYDQEGTYDPAWAKVLGVEGARLVVVRAMAGEEIGELLLKMVRDKWDLVAVDSIVGLLPEKELKRKVEEESVAVLARLLARILPKIVLLQSMSPTVVILVNQVRDKIGFFMGESQKSPGGRALEHGDSLKLRVQRKEFLTKGKDEQDRPKKIGYRMAVRVVKSKVGNEQEACVMSVYFGKGIVDE